jgi:hypothetical protein
MENLIIITLVQLVATWALVGVSWYSQIIHYPLYKKIKEGFVEYERSHIRRTAFFLSPMMLVEAISAIILVGISKGELTTFAITNLILLIFIWLATFLFQITQHQKLSVRFSNKILNNLIMSNWVRTLLWTGKGIVMCAYVYYFLVHACRLNLEHIF